ncbi:probable serine/threonine-protein kinase CST [Spinacia oleracea]|uniref:Probable serine/threonine-protein kinase CST n=1 Tax=Spinacia oleracea TaxID=3562 RepID=A0A9R0HWD6_SPIOL|nr:probable serine/threonine-protein kinase CST [Spinacia oleracea]
MGCCGSKEEVTNPIVSTAREFSNLPPEKAGMVRNNVVGGGGVGGGGRARVHGPPPPVVGRIIKPDLKVYTFSELKSATRNFRPDSVLGEGGFGRVYKGWIDKTTLAPSKVGVGIPVAVKKCSADSAQGLKEWKTEVNFLGKFSHPNLVKLIGYCWEEKELLLVYEHLNKGSLENHLFRKNVDPPSWSTRISIAMDAARGLDFLHTSENTVIYRDFKAANILLDENFGAKLSDFGLARMGPPVDRSHVTTQAVGTYGYAAPEYINTGHLYVRSDVYGFGVVMLELLTGFKAYDLSRPTGQTSLVDWYRPMLSEKSKVKKIIDPRMDEYPPEGINKFAQLILRCLQNDPKNRPPMSEVLIILERISTIRMNPKSSKPSSSKTRRPHSYHPSPTHRLGGGSSPRPRAHTLGL